MKKYIFFMLFVFLLVGCQNNKQVNEANEDNENPLTYVGYKRNGNLDNNEIARHLANLAAKEPYVRDATAVVAGNYAVVGLDVDSTIDRTRVGSIKYSVAESLRHDPYGANAVVIADPDTFERLREMSKSIRDGKPVSGITEELAEITGRLMPQIPSEITKPNADNYEPLEENNGINEIKQEQGNLK